MNVPPVLIELANEYVSTFDISGSVESYQLRKLSRDEISTSVQSLEIDDQIVYYQLVSTGLTKLRDKLANGSAAPTTIKAVDVEILKTEGLLKRVTNPLNQPSATTSGSKLPVKQQRTVEQRQQIARDYIAFLEGVNQQNQLIMTDKEFKNLLNYTDYLILHGQVPSGIHPIKPVNISKDHIKYTYYSIHKELYGTRPVKDAFINFLREVFFDFHRSPDFSTMKAKFSFMPKSYYKDIEHIKSKIGKVN